MYKVFYTLLAFILTAPFTLAASETVPPTVPNIPTLPGPKAGETVDKVTPFLMENFFPRVTTTIIGLGATGAVIFVIVGAIMMITAHGEEEQLTNAKKTLTWAIIGLFICILAFAIVQLIFALGYSVKEANA